MIRTTIILLATVLTIAPEDSGNPGEGLGADRILQDMFTAIDGVETLEFRLYNAERIAGKMLEGEQHIVLKKQPFSIYMYMIRPASGSELLYVEGRNRNEVIYNPSGFPYIRLNLDPMGAMMRRNNHHTIFEAGFSYLGDIVRSIHAGRKAAFTLESEVTFESRKCHKVMVTATSFRFVNYTVQPGETLVTIARKRKLSEHILLEANKNLGGYNDVKAGQVIVIPNLYAGRIELYVDRETSLPVMQKIYDDKGLYEQYIYRDVRVNIRLPAGAFSESNLGKKIKG